MAVALAAHDAILRSAVETAGGTVVKTTGDGCWRPSTAPERAVAAAVEGQRALETHDVAGDRAAARPDGGPHRAAPRSATATSSGRPQPGGAPAGDRTRRPGAGLGRDRGPRRRRPAARLRADRSGRASPARPGSAGARVPAGRAGPAARVPAAALDAGARHEPAGRRSPRSSGASGSWPSCDRLLTTHRLVTLVGVGGTGKTRLDAPGREDAVDRFRDGAWLVELAPISDPELVVAEVRRALGVQAQPGQPPIDAIVDYLRARNCSCSSTTAST